MAARSYTEDTGMSQQMNARASIGGMNLASMSELSTKLHTIEGVFCRRSSPERHYKAASTTPGGAGTVRRPLTPHAIHGAWLLIALSDSFLG